MLTFQPVPLLFCCCCCFSFLLVHITYFCFFYSSLEVKTSSWSGWNGRASVRSRRGYGGCGCRSSRTWSWRSLSAGPTCPEPDRLLPTNIFFGPPFSSSSSSFLFTVLRPKAHNDGTKAGPSGLAAPVTNLCQETRVSPAMARVKRVHF